MPTGQTFQMAKWLSPQLQFHSAALGSTREPGLCIRGPGEELTGPQCGDIGPGHPWGLSFTSVLRVSELSDSQYESKTEGESPSPESGY